VKDPAALVKLQRKHWDPLVEWAAQKFDAKLFTDTAIRVVDQPEMSVQNLVGACRELDNFRLSVVDDVATVARSVIVSLALLHRRISPHEAYVCARLDEDWQMRTWGRVDGAFGHGIDVAYTRLKIYAARVFTTMLDDAKL
jgi:chaperone required for assembly of F1-ATPase